jgi:hypothetical protein
MQTSVFGSVSFSSEKENAAFFLCMRANKHSDRKECSVQCLANKHSDRWEQISAAAPRNGLCCTHVFSYLQHNGIEVCVCVWGFDKVLRSFTQNWSTLGQH